MKGAFQTSAGERTEWFFEEIALRLGDRERAARKARNAPAHGGLGGDVSDEKIDDAIWHSNIYKTLFARTVLKLLDYQGEYIDRGTMGFPRRSLDEPIGKDAALRH